MCRFLKVFALLILFFSCKHTETYEATSGNEVIVAFDKVKQSSIKRDISYLPKWQDRIEFEGSYYIPLNTDKRIYSYTPDGVKFSLVSRIWLKANKQENTWNFTKLTVLPNDIRNSKGSGLFIYEDWQTGELSYEGYIEKRLLRAVSYEQEMEKVSGKIAKKAQNSPVGVICKVVTSEVCAGSGRDLSCSTRTETICTSTTVPGGGNGGNTNPPPVGSGGHGGGSGGGNNTPPIVVDDTDNTKGLDTMGLNKEQRNQLRETIEEAKTNCGYRALLEQIDKDGAIKIVVDPNDPNAQSAGGGAVYLGNKKQVIYANELYLGYPEMLTHEVFHAYQHQIAYGGSFVNYYKDQPGNINVEFEQIVFQDISRRINEGTTYVGDKFNQETLPGFGKAQEDYIKWIETLTNKGTTYPNLSTMPDFANQFIAQLKNFKTFGHPGYTAKSTVIESLGPEALKKLFNGSVNCK